MNYSILKKRACVILLLAVVVLLLFSAGCVQQIPTGNITIATTIPTGATMIPVENTTSIATDPTINKTLPTSTITEITTTPSSETIMSTTDATATLTTAPPTGTTVALTSSFPTSTPTLSEQNQQILDQMEIHLEYMITELERRELTFQMERDNFVRLPPPDGCGDASDVVIAYDRNPNMSVTELREVFKKFHYTFTYKGEQDLEKLENFEEGIVEQKADIVIKKRQINSFCKENGLSAPYESENI